MSQSKDKIKEWNTFKKTARPIIKKVLDLMKEYSSKKGEIVIKFDKSNELILNFDNIDLFSKEMAYYSWTDKDDALVLKCESPIILECLEDVDFSNYMTTESHIYKYANPFINQFTKNYKSLLNDLSTDMITESDWDDIFMGNVERSRLTIKEVIKIAEDYIDFTDYEPLISHDGGKTWSLATVGF